LNILELRDASDLETLGVNRLKSPSKKIDFKSNKWTYYFLEQEEIDFLENIAKKRKILTIGDYANVEVGITTGANNYFTVPHCNRGSILPFRRICKANGWQKCASK
jgi:adenine-specific DNA-methyltransferase